MRNYIKFKIKVIIEPDDIGFHAYCPALKGLHTYGDTEEEAFRNVKDAARAYLRSSIKHGDPIPLDIIDEYEDDTLAPQIKRRTADFAVSASFN
jgi:predicted RNase H-like HicB family nuclease